MKQTKLPYGLTIALGQYFLNSQLAREQLVCKTFKSDGVVEKLFRSGRTRDRDADSARVFAAVPKGWHAIRCAGSFWFTPPLLKNSHYYIDQELWPLARVQTIVCT